MADAGEVREEYSERGSAFCASRADQDGVPSGKEVERLMEAFDGPLESGEDPSVIQEGSERSPGQPAGGGWAAGAVGDTGEVCEGYDEGRYVSCASTPGGDRPPPQEEVERLLEAHNAFLLV